MGTAELGLGPQVPPRPMRRAFQAEGLSVQRHVQEQDKLSDKE